MFEFDLYRTPIPAHVIRQLPGGVAWECGAIPIDDGRDLVVALADAEDREMLEKLRFILAREITVVRASREAIAFALAKYYPRGEQGPDEIIDVRLG